MIILSHFYWLLFLTIDNTQIIGFRHAFILSWYTSKEVLQLEKRTTFRNNWLVVGRRDQLKEPRSYITGDICGEPFVVMMDEQLQVCFMQLMFNYHITLDFYTPNQIVFRSMYTQLRAFYNVCRHRAARLLTSNSGKIEDDCIKCPYHGWQYRLDGRYKLFVQYYLIMYVCGCMLTSKTFLFLTSYFIDLPRHPELEVQKSLKQRRMV